MQYAEKYRPKSGIEIERNSPTFGLKYLPPFWLLSFSVGKVLLRV